MTIHKEGYSSIALCILFIAVVNAGDTILHATGSYAAMGYLHIIVCVVCYHIAVFSQPVNQHSINKDETQVLCPADGKVVVIEETTETEYLKEKCIQISVFMSPINVHINRNPISGVIKYFKYHPGKYLVAWHPKSSTENERTTVVDRK